jgi:ABC-type transporter Mla MlaB component
MIDVHKITSMLAKLGDPQLQQYAQMHKNDPYIMSLAMSESNRRKEMRSAGQGGQGAQEQPKVVDQEIARMGDMQNASPEQMARLSQLLEARKQAEYKEFTGGGREQPIPQQQQQLPEDQGIGQLPAGDMNFADGGIIAFAGGGDVERYQVGGAIKATPEFLRFLQSVGGDYVQFSNMDSAGKAALVDMFEQAKAAPGAATTSAAPAAQAAQNTSRAYNAGKVAAPYLQKAGSAVKAGALPVVGAGLAAAQGLSEVDSANAFYNDPNVPTTEKAKQFARTGANVALPYVGGAIGSGITPFLGTAAGAGLGAGLAAYIDDEGEALKQYRAKNEPSTAPSGATLRSQLNRTEATARSNPSVYGQSMAETAASDSAAAGSKPSAAPSSVLAPRTFAKTGAGQGSSSTGATPSTGLRDDKSIASLYSDLRKSQEYVDPAKGEVDKLAQEQLAAATRRKQEYEDFVTKQGDVYKDRSDRLVEREKGIGKQVDQNMGLALLNAGLSIMSTPGSLATAIGKGAQVGTAQFAAGLGQINLARDRLADAKDKMDDLRMNRDEMTFKQRSVLEADIDKAQIEARKMGIDGIRAAAGVTEKRAETLLNKTLDMEKTRFEQSEQTKRTLATINASNDGRTKQLWAGLMQKHGNDPVAAAKEYNTIEQGDKPTQAAEKLVQDRVGEWEKANKLRLSMLKPAEQAAELRSAEKRLRESIYTQFKLSPTMGAGASSTAGFRMVD